VDRRQLAFRALEPWIKTLLMSVRAKLVNKFLEEKLQRYASARIPAQRVAGGGRVFSKTEC
jgi:hypothetical protein